MSDVRVIPTFLRIQVTAGHKLSGAKYGKNTMELKLKSFFNFNSVSGAAKLQIYQAILSGGQVGNVILPYAGIRPAKEWQYGLTSCDLENMHTTDRVLICGNANEVSEEDAAKEALFAETDVKKQNLTVHMAKEEYDELAPGRDGLKLLIRNFYGTKHVLFECRVDKIPIPGVDGGNYVFSDGSRTQLDVAKGEAAAYDWGNLSVRGDLVKAAIGNGRSTEWNAAAEKEGCLHALKDNLCGWTKDDDVTVFFDCVNNAYPLVGWFSETDYAREVKKLAENFKSLTFYHIDAHTGVVGNELADSIANIKLRESRYRGLGMENSLSIDSRHLSDQE